MSLTRLVAVMRKEFIQVLRDKNTLRIVIAMPVIMMFLFGYVVSTDVKSVPTAVALQDTGQPARDILERFQQTGYFKVVRYVGSAAEAGQLIQAGQVKVAIVVPSDYSQNLQEGRQAQVQVLVDGSDPIISRMAVTTTEMLGQLTGRDILTQRLQRLAGSAASTALPVDVRARVWYNPNMDSIKFNLPGLVGAILQNITIILIAGAMVREREHGTMEQLIVTPVKSAELIIGKMAPYVVIALIDASLVIVIGVLMFHMQIVGSLLVLALASFIFLLSSLGLGLLISTVSQNQIQAMQLSQMFVLPSLLLSGYMFPREAMPPALQAISLALPLTHFLQILRGVILKGMGLDLLWHQTSILAGYTVVILALAVWRLQKKLD